MMLLPFKGSAGTHEPTVSQNIHKTAHAIIEWKDKTICDCAFSPKYMDVLPTDIIQMGDGQWFVEHSPNISYRQMNLSSLFAHFPINHCGEENSSIDQMFEFFVLFP